MITPLLKYAKYALLVILVALPLALSVHGLPGNISESDMNGPGWIGGPFELSVERGRFALTYSLAENRSVHFSVALARFALPDLGFADGHYVSLFAPGVSILALPGYYLGKFFGASQVGAFMTSAVFAALNFFLIRAIAVRLGASPSAALLGSIAFLFATPAFAYATTLYQHHISTFLILSSLYLSLVSRSWWSTSLIWAICAASILVDYPNLFLLLPIGVLTLSHMVSLKVHAQLISVTVGWAKLLTLLTILVPLAGFLWFSSVSYHNPWQFSGTVASVREIGPDGSPAWQPSAVAPKTNSDTFAPPPPPTPHKSALNFFNPRNLLNGLYIHLLSLDRGVLVYTPVILLGLIGLGSLLPSHRLAAQTLMSIALINLVLYSLWGDPWGGWAFGSRYLIPAYALGGIGLGFLVDRFRRSLVFLFIFSALLAYSLLVNTLGAITLIGVPPKVEVSALESLSGRLERYSFDRNFEHLLTNNSKSFVFQAWAKFYLSALDYYLLVLAFPSILSVGLIISLSRSHDH